MRVTTQPAHKEALNNIGGGVYVTDERLKKIRSNQRTRLTLHELATTDDATITRNGYHKPNRRVTVINVNRNKMTVAQIKSLAGKKEAIQRGKLIPLKDDYKSLPRASGVDVISTSRDSKGRPLRTDDRRFKSTGEHLSRKDARIVKRGSQKFWHRHNKKKKR